MTILIITLHVIVCLALIMIVLLQTGKGADMGAAFGGGSSQTLFGSTGASTFLSKATTVAAVVFMLTCFSLAYLSSNRQTSSVMEEVKTPTEQSAPAQSAVPEESASAEQTAPETPAASAQTGDSPEKAE